MASSQGIRAGKAFVELFADDTKLVRGLKAAEQRLKAFGAGIRSLGTKVFSLGAAIVAPLVATTNVFASMGDQLAKMAIRTGISVEALSELGYAAEQSGSDLATLENGVRKMQKFLVDASKGSQTASFTLGKLGLRLADLAGLAPDEQFALLADRLSEIRDPTLRAALAMEIFGRTGTNLLPLMQDGAKGIEELKQQARDLGLTIRTEDAQAAEVFGDRLSDLWKVMKSGTFAIGATLAPLLQDLVVRATKVVKVVVDWVRQNQQLVITVFKLGAAAMAGGAAVIVLGSMISGIGAVLGMFAGIVTGVGTVLGMLGTVIGALLSPVVVVSAAVAALGAYLLYASGLGAKALSWLAERFVGLKNDALAAWQGIGDALAAGDIGLAAKILWLTLKLQWQKGVAALNEVWATVKEFFQSTWTEAVYGTAKIATNAWAGLQTAWTHTVDFLADAWAVFTAGLAKTWHKSIGFIQKAWVKLKGLFDDEVDAEAEITRINEEVAAKNKAVDDERNQKIFEREQARKQRLGEIEGERSGTIDQLNQMRDAEHAARQRRNAADQGESEQALQQARKEWQDAIAEAARKRKDVEAAGEPERMKKAQLHLSQMGELMTDLGDAKVSVKGTFNAFGARGLGSEGPAERTAKAAEEIAKNTRRLLNEAQHGGLKFG